MSHLGRPSVSASGADTLGMEFEVFLSFRGPDTRDNFTSCLYHDMIEKGIRVFKDDEELRIGQQIGGNLLQALDNTQIYIPIFSKGFASSPWCLREVAHMVDCTSKSDGKKEILPLFFDVKPDDVKLRTELYSNDLSKHEKNHGTDEVKRWKAALREVATRVGWTGQGKEYGELLKLIVREVLLKLKVKNRLLPNNLVKMDNDEDIEELMKVDSDDDHVRFIIIYGTGGIGKTTLASIIFNRFRSKFDYSSFLEDVHELSHRHGLLHVQKKLLFDTLGSSSDRISDINDGINQLKRGLKEKKVLVVLDNVNDKNQLETLAGSHKWFPRGSRIIVTVRDRRTILDRIIIDEDEQKRHVRYIEYPVKLMPLDRSIQLFSKYAFRSNTPPKDWLNFSKDVILSIGRLPLTLEVVGSLFAGTDRSKWDETLKDLKQVPCQEVREALMISFNKLGHHNQEIFLDIACFCIGEDKMHANYMWTDCGYYPHGAIEDLQLMSLIKINEDNTFWMHNEVRDLGRYIVKEVSFEDAGKRRWVEIGENTLDILSSIEEKGDVRALTLGITYDLTPEELACLPKLRFLGGQTLNFVGDFKNLLKKLLWLSWHHFLPNFSATNLHLVNLVVLNLSRSNITHDWNGWRQIEMAKKLKFLDLTECYNLTRTPDFSEFGKLEKLIFARCCQLSTIDSSISKLKSLSTLDIQGCTSLEGLPEEIGSTQCLSEIIMPHFGKLFKLPDTLGNLKSLTKFEVIGHYGISQIPHSIGRLNLTHLVLSSCNNLHELPDSIGELELLIKLDLRFSGISVLPESIGQLKNLEHLLLHHCENLHKLPDSTGELESLIELDLSFSRISVLPSIERLKNLKYLYLSCINLHKLPDSIGELESLVELNLGLSGISVLPNSLGRLKNLRHLFFFACMNLHKLPDSIGELELLINLDLEFSRISIAPNSIGGLTNLMQLSFSRCENLHELPNSIGELQALVELNLELSGISIVPDSIGRLMNLMHLSFSRCENLHVLPDSIGELQALVELNLELSGISILPESIGRLKNLKHLLLSKCKNLHDLPDSMGGLESLIKLDLDFSGVSILPSSIGRLRNFTHLSFSECNNPLKLACSAGEPKLLIKLEIKLSEISVVLDFTKRLKSLTHISFFGCNNLHKLSDSIEEMELLVELNLKLSGISLLPDSIGNMKSLKVLTVAHTKIHTIPCALGRVETLEELDASFCPHLMDEIPWEMWSLTRLRILNLDGSPISTVPRKISGFSSLQTLKITSHRLSPLPQLPSSLKCLVVAAAEFPVLPDLSSLVHLDYLEVRKEERMTLWIPNVVSPPWKDMPSTNRLSLSLSTLKLHSIPKLPNISDFQSLSILSISECPMPRLPDLSHLKRLQKLSLTHFPKLVEIPGLGKLESLKFLHIISCDVIRELPNLSKLTNLLHLELRHCAKLRAVQGLKELKFLKIAEISYCVSLERLPKVPPFTNLETEGTPKCTIHPSKRLRLSAD